MNEKILTISIAAYNVQEYIRDALESIVQSNCLDKLEVFIINDGSTDDTSIIAKEYEMMYPHTFYLISKKNGGYGSTVNWSVKHANGRYFRLLDGDDWFDSDGLKLLVDRMEKTDSDMIVSEVFKSDGEKMLKDCYPFCRELDGKILTITEAAYLPVVGMWACSIKTNIVKQQHCDLPEHTLYTDSIYLVNSMFGVKTIEFFGRTVYYYRIGRGGQSIDLKSIEKHYPEMIAVTETLLKTYKENNNIENEYIRKRVFTCYFYYFKLIYRLEHNVRNFKIIKKFEKETKRNCLEIYKYNKSKRLKLLRASLYLLYWVNFPLEINS